MMISIASPLTASSVGADSPAGMVVAAVDGADARPVESLDDPDPLPHAASTRATATGTISARGRFHTAGYATNGPRQRTRGVAAVRAHDQEGCPVRQQVEETIEAIRPALQADGGDIFLREVDEESGVITVTLVGACGTCPASTDTLKAGIERIMKDRVDGIREVVAV